MIPAATVTIAGQDQTCLVLEATIRRGRDDPAAQPDADTATVQLLGAPPADLDIGSAVTVVAALGGTSYPRFTGAVTDLATGWETSIDRPATTIVAASPLAQMGRRVIGDQPWPQESDGARVNRVIGLAGVPTDPARTDPGTVAVLARDVDAAAALELARDTAADGGGMLWQTLDGPVVYADANHRRNRPWVELDLCTIPLGVAWMRGLDGLVNDLRIRYGPTPEGGEQAELHTTDPASIAQRGTYAASITSSLADLTAATARAETILVRQADPVWSLNGIELDLDLITRAYQEPAADLAMSKRILDLDLHDLVLISGLPAGSPYTSAWLFVEGWSERIAAGYWRIALATSDMCRTVPPPRWDDLNPAWTWDKLDPGLTWDGITCLPPQPSQGRWADIPSTLRWDQVAPAVTWDTWKG